MKLWFEIPDWILGAACLICFLGIVIQMFRAGNSRVGIVALFTFPLCGTGYAVAFVWGWLFASEHGLQRWMTLWTALTLAWVGLIALSFALDAPLFDLSVLKKTTPLN
jgi:hypothetical protein